ncbi:hypothetical protein PENSPDRAFT_753267 [Peniophora sp. CONT]|nr:hypothetical protein PENSPDRAFT_753267 [Peniophora sp. CONT]
MKIVHKSKRALPPLPQVAELIQSLLDTPDDELADVLGAIDHWRWPRSDLNAWVPVLNKLDAVLEDAIRAYAVDELQLTPFTPSAKRTVCEILRFERLLLENSTNRKTFASYDRINSLFATSDLDVLVLALNLLLRPAQQYSAQPAVSRALSISTPRLLSLAKRWSHLREYGLSPIDLVTETGVAQIDNLPAEAREVNFTFYKAGKSEPAKDPVSTMDIDSEAPAPSEVPKTPVRRNTAGSTQAPPPSSGAVTIHIDSATLTQKSTMEVLADVLERHELPGDDKFELMCRIRAAQMLLAGSERAAEREKLLAARLIAVSIFVHTHSETTTTSSLFLYEPDLTPHISELLALDRGVPVLVQTAAIAALDALARYRSRVQDVLSAVNAGVNHGTLMALLRKTVAEVAHPECALPHAFVDALISFVTYLASHAQGGGMIVGAGLVPLLIQVIENRLPQRLPMVSKTMQLVDNVLYSFTNAFTLFCTGKGVDVLVERIAFEVDEGIRLHGHEEKNAEAPRSYGLLPVVRSAALKHILRSMHRMMQSSGTAEGLRGLIDSSLLHSIRKVMEHRALFGPNILPIAINVMATFVHNEPTSLAVIQEVHLPETFYRTVEAGLEPVIEVIQAIPNAIGALCLNQAGQDQLAARPTIIPGYFSIFSSERHLRVLQDKENAVIIGSAVDELVRHHPILRPAVFDAVRVTLSRIEDMGKTYTPPASARDQYEFVRPQPASQPETRASEDVQMEIIEPTDEENVEVAPTEQDKSTDDDSSRKPDNPVVTFLDVVCRFLEGLFQHTPHCKEFLSNFGALEQIGRITALPALPHDFGNSVASDSLVQVVRTMFDASPNVTMGALCELVKTSLKETKEFWEELKPGSRLLELMDTSKYGERQAAETFRRIITLHVRVMLLSDVYSTVGYAHGRSALGLLQILMGRGAPEVLPELGALHRALVWENVQMKSSPTVAPSASAAAEPSTAPLLEPAAPVPEPVTNGHVSDEALLSETPGGSTSPTPAPVPTDATPAPTPTVETKKDEDDPALRALKQVAMHIPNALTPFFQAIIKLFSTRRHPDENQKQSIKDAAGRLSVILLQHLQPIKIEGSRLDVTAYYTSLVGLVATFLIEERSGVMTLFTVLLSTFYKDGGFDALLNICRHFITVVEELSPIGQDARTAEQATELGSAYGGLKIALHLLHPVVSTKPIFESPQTGLLLTRDKKDGEPGYFEPHNFLVRMRLAVLPLARELWTAPWLSDAPSGLVRSVAQTVLEIANAEGEENQAPQIPGGGPGVPGGPAAALFNRQPVVADEARIAQIQEMGFPRWAAERALARTANNVNAATELLLANPFRFQPDAPPPAQAAAAGLPPVPAAPAQAPAAPATPPNAEPAVPAEPVVPAEDAEDQDEEMVDEDGDGEGEGEGEGDGEGDGEDDNAEGSDGEGDDAESAQDEDEPMEAPAPAPEPEAPKEPVKTSAQWREELNTAREPLKADLGSTALKLVDAHPTLIFDMQTAFVGKPESFQKESIRLLVRDVRAFAAHAIDSQEQPLAVRCRLLALVLNEAPASFAAVVKGDEITAFVDQLVALVLSAPVAQPDRGPPKWLAAILLVAESILTIGLEPRTAQVPKEGEPVPTPEVVPGPHFPNARPRLFDFALRLLALPSLARDDLISALRLLVLLTRDHVVAQDFARRDGVPLLFKALRASSGGANGCQSYITIILRHVVEDPATLRSIMRQETDRFLAAPRPRPTDVATYVRSCLPMVLRDPKAFLDATTDVAKLEKPYASTPLIARKDKESTTEAKPDEAAAVDASAAAPATAPTDAVPAVSAPPDYLEGIVHFLVGELVQSIKPQAPADVPTTAVPPATPSTSAQPQPQPEAAPSTSDAPKDTTSADKEKQSDIDFYYCGFVMQCLAELLFSYDVCKVAFLSYSPKKRTADAPSKFRTYALQFLLNDVISYGTLQPESADAEARKRVSLCNWAMSIIVALCVDTTASPDLKDVAPELVHVRKFVLEAASRAIKEPAPSDREGLGARYGRVLALADLCHRLLTVRYATGGRKNADEAPPTHIAKIMLEKNFVATLTTALAEVDLNFPNVRGLVQAVLKPLELLSRIAIKMSRASSKGKGDDGKLTLGEVEEMSEDDDEDDDDEGDDGEGSGREDTPDLYRNSALGMFGGEIDDQYADDDEMGDEDEEDEEDVEMDFGEESDDTEESDVDVDVEIEGGLDEEDEDDEEGSGDEEEEWDDEDDGEGEDLVEEDDVEPVAELSEEVAGEEDDEEGQWEDVEGEEVAGMMEHGGGEDGGAEMAIFADEDEDDGGMGSDEDFLDNAELGFLEAVDGGGDDMFRGADGTLAGRIADMVGGVGTIGGPAHTHNIIVTGGLPLPVANEGDDMEVFGRQRGNQAAPEIVTHPLLLDGNGADRAGGQGRVGRRARNGNPLAGALGGTQSQDLLAAIEDVIGGSNVQLFSSLLARRPGGEAIRVDVPPGAFDRHGIIPLSRRGGPAATLASMRVRGQALAGGEQRPESSGFDPLVTLNRWNEEVKILNGKFMNERATRVANHVILRLLPDAIKRAEEDAKTAEQERERQREEEEKARLEAEAKAREEQAATEKAEAEAAAARAAEAEAAANAAPAEAPTSSEDVEMHDQPAESTNEEPVAGSSAEGQAEASTSAAPERVTVMIHGNAVDITDTGIDPTFLEALPDDMREEVVNQHIRDQRAARVERPADSQISAEFLDALPPEIRAEIIQQERIEQARRQPPAATGGNAGPAEMDPATFMASLDPALRQEVLMEQDDGFIQSLPAHMIAEAGGYREHREQHPFPVPHFAPARPASTPTQRKPAGSRDAIQLLDKSGIAVLIRLLFFPQLLKKSMLFKVLVNLCENGKTRTELFNILLNILQDGATDLAAIDRSFAQMTVRPPKTPAQTPKAAGKQRSNTDYFSSLPVSQLPSEVLPDLIAQRCLEALSYIVSANERSSLFFLTEHELPVGLRRGVSKKGKGKEKATAQTQYPVVLLLNLLDRQSLLKTPSILESLVSLLDNITRPLKSLKDPKSADKPEAALASTSSAPPAESATTEAPAADADAPESAPAPEASEAAPAETQPAAAILPAKDEPKTVEEKILLANPPQIPHAVLRLIVNILTVGECGAKPFHHSLSLIQHLSYIPDAREVVAQELRVKAQELGQSLQRDLDDLAKALGSVDADVMASSVASKFSSPSSDQAKLLRVLKTIDYMYSPKHTTTAEAQANTDVDKIQGIYESFRFTPLWKKLGDCLSVIEERPEMEHIATVLLPLIEALMVVCKYVGSTSSATNAAARAVRSPSLPPISHESMEELFVSFTDAHRKVLNAMVRNNPSLMSGSFSLLVHNPRVLDFDNKRNYFSQQLHRRPSREHFGTLQLNVRRQRVFEDSFQYLQRKNGDQIKYGKLSVRFYDEEGVDAGGVTREWFQILARQMFDPNNALFEPCAADRLTYQPNKASWVNPEHLSFFKFVGRVIGKAIYDGRLLDAYFARSLYRQILQKPVDYRDVEWIDPDYYKSLCWILENDPTPLDMNFSVEGDEFGVMKIVNLKPDGDKIPVTLENRREFVQLSAQYRLYESIKDQLEALLGGFYEIIPKDLVTIFNEQELELLISGTPDVDVDEWRAATEYNGYTSSDPVIVWWWRALKSFTRDERAKLLSFATGTSRVPLNGFGDLQGVQGTQRFSIHRAYGDTDRLPQAHTCFNQIDLPQYSSYEMLRQQLLLAINEGGEGFGFA